MLEHRGTWRRAGLGSDGEAGCVSLRARSIDTVTALPSSFEPTSQTRPVVSISRRVRAGIQSQRRSAANVDGCASSGTRRLGGGTTGRREPCARDVGWERSSLVTAGAVAVRRYARPRLSSLCVPSTVHLVRALTGASSGHPRWWEVGRHGGGFLRPSFEPDMTRRPCTAWRDAVWVTATAWMMMFITAQLRGHRRLRIIHKQTVALFNTARLSVPRSPVEDRARGRKHPVTVHSKDYKPGGASSYSSFAVTTALPRLGRRSVPSPSRPLPSSTSSASTHDSVTPSPPPPRGPSAPFFWCRRDASNVRASRASPPPLRHIRRLAPPRPPPWALWRFPCLPPSSSHTRGGRKMGRARVRTYAHSNPSRTRTPAWPTPPPFPPPPRPPNANPDPRELQPVALCRHAPKRTQRARRPTSPPPRARPSSPASRPRSSPRTPWPYAARARSA
ncbi:hypothetical protein BC628DRAFT_1032723 [Trametes gibbosa]|nr:hypothetical protein BC628DRAFT_1032723 [Trametes gibbosa]